MSTLADKFSFLFSRRNGMGNRFVARWLFLRFLGLIYFSAFFALLFQIRGLVGAQGILPAGEYLQALQQQGAARFWLAPSVFWLWHSDAALMTVCWVGLLASVLATLNVAPRLALLVCFICFLAFIGVSQDFGEYQSDGMLLAAGFLSLFVAPAGIWPGWGRRSWPVRAAVWLLVWEWFRIYFQSGVVKLASGDPTWRNLTAMYEYYQNGPLPTWVGWYLQHLPHWFHIATAAITLIMELGLVWLVFAPRRFRIVLFWMVTVWQAGVILTANYAFLNYLVLVLGFWLLDDEYLLRFVPRRWRSGLMGAAGAIPSDEDATEQPRWRVTSVATVVSAFFLSWVAYSTTAQMLAMISGGLSLGRAPIRWLEPFRIANSYGLFATMTPHRYEIEFQGSDDGKAWTPYPFRYKPQDVHERPRIYAPYQPRFDWNLWFASLGPWQQAPIVPPTEERLLDGSPSVLELFRDNPFSAHAPRYVRAVLWQYWFSTPAEKRARGVWWRRQYLGTYAPTLERLPDGRYGEVEMPELAGRPDL